MKAFAGIAEDMDALPGWIVRALKFQWILDFFQGMDFVLHVRPDGLPVADGLGLAISLEFQGVFLARVRVIEANSKAVLALHAIFGNALRLRDPGDQLFPGDKDWLFLPLRHETYFAALAVETGGDYVF